MYTVTILSHPEQRSLTLGQITITRDHWQGGEITWLAEHEAASFHIPALPDDQWQVWQDYQNEQIDMTIQPGYAAPKAMLIADMDSTMIHQECLDEMAELAGVGDYVRDVTMRAMNGEIQFEEALKERVALLKGQSVSIIDQIISSRLSFMPGGATLLATMRRNGSYAALVSGGFTPFTSYVAEQLGFDEHHGNRLIISDGMLTGEVAPPIQGKDAKRQALINISSRLGLSHDQVMAVGDGANDLDMIAAAGIGVAFHAKPSVAAAAQYRLNHGDLTALLYLQGYRKASFFRP
jgi:phosphoserine phosphatase